MIAAKKINFFCLFAAIVFILAIPLKKEIWYDETVSIRISKGMSHDIPSSLSGTTTTSAAALAQLNTAANVFDATVNDNANSYLYNIGLHWFTLLFGNSLYAYMLFSKLCSIAALIAFYILCSLFFENSLFTSLSILLLVVNNTFTGMSHEIRAYSMGIMFVTLAAICLYKFLYREGRPVNLFFTALFSVCAVLSHFLSVYIILVFLWLLIYKKRVSLFSIKNLIALSLPLCILVLFFYYAYSGLQTMSRQNVQIQQKHINEVFSLIELVMHSMKFAAINFSSVFPAFGNHPVITVLSFILIVGLYFFSRINTTLPTEKRNLDLLFALGISGTLFLSLLSIKAHNYTPFYNRYYSFCTPFCSLFTAYVLYILFKSKKLNSIIKGSSVLILSVPACVLFLLTLQRNAPRCKYNHVAVAQEIVKEKISKIEVPEWEDALLIQCFLPKGYQLDYVLNPNVPNFTLYNANTTEKIPVVKDNS